jgi:hypothetical protein
MINKLVEQLVETILRLVPGKGFTQLRDTIRYAQARIEDGTIDDPKQLEQLGQMSVNAIVSILQYRLSEPASKADTGKQPKEKS